MDGKKKTILLVEDDSSIQEVLSFYLEIVGYNVKSSHNGLEALEYLSQHEAPDAVVVDIMMPQMGGVELLERMRAEPGWADIPAIVASAVADLPGLPRARGYLRKPLELETLREALARVCG